MRRFIFLTMTLIFCLLGAEVHAQSPAQKAYVRDDLASTGTRLEEQLKKDAAGLTPSRPVTDLVRDATQLVQKNNPRGALRPLAAAITASPRDPALWLMYARTALAAGQNNNDLYTQQENSVAAAYIAYQRASTKTDEATALAWLGDAYARRTLWRLSLNAYSASLAGNDVPAVRTTYEQLRAQYGFRVLREAVDSDSATPRVCFPFSEPLARGKVDFAPYVAVSGNANPAVTTDDQQLCVEGLKHGERYSIVLRQGLPSSVGENLLKSADFEIYVRDRSPQVRFTGKNYVLPRVGQEGIPLVSVNTPKVAIDILRIGDRNILQAVRSSDFLTQLGTWAVRKLVSETGQKVWSGTLDTRQELNKDVITAFPVLEAAPKLEPGVYVMVARAGEKPITAGMSSDNIGNDDSDTADMVGTQWFVISDLGLTSFTGTDGVHVLVRSLATAEPLAGIEIRLVARNNEILGTLTTGADGHVKFDPGLARGTGGLSADLLVARDSKDDYNFLDIAQAAFDLTDRGVKGRNAPKALDAFVYAERGVYRSGETVNLTTILRDGHGVAVGGLPLTIVTKRPDGVEYKNSIVADQGMGGRAYSLPLLSNVASGTWRVQVFSDPKSPAIGETSFLVEDYVPERLDVTLKPQQPILRQRETAKIDVEARYLYGAPGAGLDVSGKFTLRTVAEGAVPGMPGYVAGLQDEEFEAVNTELEDAFTTDDKGRTTVEIPIPETKAPRPLEARIVLLTGETGGRAVERAITLPVFPDRGILAVKKTFGDLAEGATATFDVIGLAPTGERAERHNVHWSLYRVANDYQWYNSDGRWGFERVKSSKRIADGRIDLTTQDPAKIAAQVGWGTHRLDLTSDDGTDSPTSVNFDVGWSGDASADTPDLLQVTLDKTQYAAGDKLKVAITSRFAGKATVAVVGERVEQLRTLDVKIGDNVLELPVDTGWGASAYAVVLAHRPLDQAARRMPGRALGVAWFGIDQEARKLGVKLDVPAKIEPRRALSIPVRISNLAAGEEAYVTLAAVDIGILNLTRYESPDATKFYFGQRLLATDVRDLYGLLIDGMQGTRGAIRSGGDSGGPETDGNKPTQEPLARYSGVVKVGADGVAQVTFDIPAFNGAMRVMAVAWSKGKVGQASTDVIVRDPVVVQATLPRFLALGDRSRFFIQLDNVEGPAGAYTVDLDIHGPVTVAADALRRNVTLQAGGKTAFSIPVMGSGVGTAVIDLALSGPGIKLTQSFALKVQSGAAELYRRTVHPITPGTTTTITGDLLADFVPGTGAVSLAVSPMGGIDVPALLQSLDRYPYGCSEQIVSRAMPLLYVNKLAAQELLPIDGALGDRVRDSIARVLTRQDASGAFGLWSAEATDDLWLHAYVSDFLTRARENGFTVPQKSFDQALDHLRNAVVNAGEVEAAKSDALAYGIYVLARNGRPIMGDLRYLADTKLASFNSPLARAQLAAALAMLGDRGRAQTVFAAAQDKLTSTQQQRFSRADYGSRLRDSAGLLTLGAENGLARAELLKASLVLEQERAASAYTSTQENGWLILAAQALSRETQNLALTIDGSQHQGAYYRTYKGLALEGKSVVLGNEGKIDAQLVITTSGNPVSPEPAAEQGYRIERSYYKPDGKPVDPGAIRQNDRLVVVLKVTELEAAYARLMLVDHLPAGLEIDNPDLFDGGSVEDLAFLKRDVEPTHTEYRDDRFVAAFDRTGKDKATFNVAYMVRAVTPGHYVLPPASIGDMYRPQRFGRMASGAVEIAEKR